MFRNKALTTPVDGRPTHGLIGWKVIDGIPMEYIYITEKRGWVLMETHRKEKEEAKARNIELYSRPRELPQENSTGNCGTARLFWRVSPFGSAW